ncbi:phosphatidylglycerol lysyltransferase domain-containing protein [Geodermatophilus sp. SYSU D00742]
MDEVIGVLQRHAHHPSAFYALNRGVHLFRLPGVDGLIASRPAGRRHVVQLTGVVGPEADADRLLDAFLARARAEGRRVVAVQLLAADVDRYVRRGFRVEQFGVDSALSLPGWAPRGGRFVKLRNKVSRARRAGVTVREVGPGQAGDARLTTALAELEERWLRAKGPHARRLEFLVGERGGPADVHRRLFVAEVGGEVVGDLSLSPVYGRHAGWLHDLPRRRPDAPPGVSELLTVTALERVRAEGAGWLHLGLTPFTGLAEEHRVPAAGSPLARRTVRLLAEHGAWLYPAADQAAYKAKWAPDVVQPEYVAFQGRVTPGAVWALARLTNAV